jgi:putative transposase
MLAGSFFVKVAMLSARIRRRLITAPVLSRPAKLQLFFGRSRGPRSASIKYLPSDCPDSLCCRGGGAGHPLRLARSTGDDRASAWHRSGNVEFWFGDEARIGQKKKTTRHWAKRGSRPSSPLDQRTAFNLHHWRHLSQGWQGHRRYPALVRSAMMNLLNLHFTAISADVASGRHAVLLLDQAGWHLSSKLRVPNNIPLFRYRRTAPS